MFRVTLQVLLCAVFAANTALAARDIVLLAGNPDKVWISDEYGTIHITDGDPETFVFECFDRDLPGEPPADIEDIGLSGTPSGTILRRMKGGRASGIGRPAGTFPMEGQSLLVVDWPRCGRGSWLTYAPTAQVYQQRDCENRRQSDQHHVSLE